MLKFIAQITRMSAHGLPTGYHCSQQTLKKHNKPIAKWKHFQNADSGGSRGENPAMAPIQFGYRLWPPPTKKYTWDTGKHTELAPLTGRLDLPHDVAPPSRMSGSATECRHSRPNNKSRNAKKLSSKFQTRLIILQQWTQHSLTLWTIQSQISISSDRLITHL